MRLSHSAKELVAKAYLSAVYFDIRRSERIHSITVRTREADLAIKLFITDLDNTLYDWVGYYIPSFLAMVGVLSKITGVSPEQLKAAFKRVHEMHRCTEYAFAIEELDVLADIDRGLSVADRIQKYFPAIEAFRQKRRELLHLYDTVPETLEALKNRGIRIAALTDATTYYASRRLRQLNIEDYFDLMCASDDHGVPADVPPSTVRSLTESEYHPRIGLILPSGNLRKPNPDLVGKVLNATRTEPHEALLLGDSLFMDVRMAQQARVWDAFAAYGAEQDESQYHELVKITYWRAADIAEYERLRHGAVQPSFTVRTFSEVLNVIESIDTSSPRVAADNGSRVIVTNTSDLNP